MFSYLRYFALVSLLLVALSTVLLSYYFSETKKSELIEGQRRAVQATISSYGASVWQRYAAAIIGGADPLSLAGFKAETEQFFHPQAIAKVTIFSTNVQRLYYSSTDNVTTTDGSSRIPLFELDKAQSGRAIARLLEAVYFGDATTRDVRHMVQLVVPLSRPGNPTPEALAEVYIDVTEHAAQLRYLRNIIISSMVGTLALMVIMLLYSASRAEAIITRQHEVNLELTAAASQAEAQSRDKSQFLASVSHELRTPLNAIIGFSEILRNEVKAGLEKVYQDYIDDIHASGKHLLSLINDILDFSKAEAGKLQIDWAETDATKIVRNSLRMVLPRAESAQVTLVEDIPPEHLIVTTDGKKLKQVLLNLLSNAVKFTKPGGEVRCQAWSEVATGNLVMVVKDTGIGIAPKDISKVMTPFGQVDSQLSRKYEGTGLGLPLSKKFIESMGGTFAIESELNVGTTITITIPKSPPPALLQQFVPESEKEKDSDVEAA